MKLIVEIDAPPGADGRKIAKLVRDIIADRDGHFVSASMRAALDGVRVKVCPEGESPRMVAHAELPVA